MIRMSYMLCLEDIAEMPNYNISMPPRVYVVKSYF